MKPECEIDARGNKSWWLNDELHREAGPAIEYTNGSKEWYLRGKLHREDGPSVEYTNGTKRWWLNGNEYSKEDYWKQLYDDGKIDEAALISELL